MIEAAGQIVVLVSEDDEILAGHHALDINSCLGRWLQVMVVVATGARTEAQKLAAARAMCPWPRRLTRKEKRDAIAKTLGMRPGKSDRTVAAEVSAEQGETVSDTTVLRVRRELLQKSKTKQKPMLKGASKRK